MSGPQDPVSVCQQCGRVPTGAERFCTSCGTPLARSAAMPATEPLSTVGHPAPAVLKSASVQSDRGVIAIVAAAAVLVIILIGVALYVGGVFSSTGTSSATITRAASAATAASGTTPSYTAPQSPPTTATPTTTTTPQRSSASGPATTMRTYLTELGSGNEAAAYRMMGPAYREKNPSWVGDREQGQPQVKILSIGSATYRAGEARVPVDFYAWDKNRAHESDTQCREFSGIATLIAHGGEWQYEPLTSGLSASERSESDPNCPA